MSRFTIKEPLAAAQRHLSSTSPSRAMGTTPVHSGILASFDEEFARLQVHDGSSTAIIQQTSNAMRMALGTLGTGAARGSAIKTTPFAWSAARQTNEQHDGQPSLPLYSYKASSPIPVRIYIRDEQQANQRASQLKGPLGFDLEWRVIFRRGEPERKTAILQLCDDRIILIIQLSAMKGFPEVVKKIMEAKDVVKMGVNVSNDARKLMRDYGVVPAGLLELTHLANLVDPARVPTKRMISLQRIVEIYTGCTLSKGNVRTSNWEMNLNEEQLEYAANDAHSALKVYKVLMQLGQEKGLALEPVPTPRNTSQRFATNPPTGDQCVIQARAPILNERGSVLASGAPSHLPTRHGLGVIPVTSPEQSRSANLKRPARGQHLRAYKLWHEEKLSLPEMCAALRSPENPLARSTVISYVVEALKVDDSLIFSRQQLREFVMLDYGSWQRHGWWVDRTKRGLP